MRLNAFSTPLSSTTAITNGWPISAACRSAASTMALARAVVTLGRSNVAAITCSCLCPCLGLCLGRGPDRVALLGLAHLGQPDEIHELRERGKLAHRRGGRARLGDLPQYPAHGPGRRQQGGDREDDDPVAKFL